MSAAPKIRAGFDPETVRGDFEILGREVYGKPLVYLDNGASAQKPQAVMDAMRGLCGDGLRQCASRRALPFGRRHGRL